MTSNFRKLVERRTKEPALEIDFRTPRTQPYISVCIPTYNQADSIFDAVSSVLSQETNHPFEILIGDDESTDGTREICLELAKKHPRNIRLILNSRKNNITICEKESGWHNLLYLLSKSNGKYIAICEGDDQWCNNNKLQIQCDLLDARNTCDLSFHPANLYRGGEFKSIIAAHSEITCVLPASSVISGGGGFCPTASILFRREILDRFPEWIFEVPVLDYFIQCFGAQRGGAIFTPEVMSRYNIYTRGSWTSSMYTDRRMEFLFGLSLIKHLRIFNSCTLGQFESEILEHQRAVLNNLLTKKMRLNPLHSLILVAASGGSYSIREKTAHIMAIVRQVFLH